MATFASEYGTVRSPQMLPLRVSLLLLTTALCLGGAAQCVNPIAVFPHLEDFEGGLVWTSGGVASDWAWGTPAHPVINTAGGGTRSWCVGGLNGQFYNFGQLSWIESPCYDLSTLDHPWVSFKIFWESERQYDGMVLQVSTNAGTSWSNVGAWGDPVNCLNDNWFNYGNVTNLTGVSPKHGWTGRDGTTVGSCLGGFGSQTWVEAKHCVPGAANQAQVKFRFLFGAGTTCNSYDGIAIDDFLVRNAPSTDAAFITSCQGNTVSFTQQATSCPTSYSWDFGDPGSGAQNTSTQADPTHTYPGPGTYPVTLTVNGPCSDPGTITIPVTILGVTATATDPLCNGQSGSASAQVQGTSGAVQYDWQPGGQTTATVGNLAPGTYTVVVSVPDGCPAQATVVINAPAPVVATAMADTTVCAGADLTLTATATGGTGGYQFFWTPSGPLLSPAVAGTYAVVATDGNGCVSLPDQVTVGTGTAIAPVFTVDAPTGCEEHCVQFTDLTPGSVSSTWQFGDGGGTTGPAPQHCYDAGSYDVQLTVTDASGCSGTAIITDMVTAFPSPVAAFNTLPLVATISDPTFTFLDVSQGATQWSWVFGEGSTSVEASPLFTYPDVGCYPVSLQVTSAEGCTDETGYLACVEGEYALFAPNAFTPDGDGINDGFLPVSSVLVPKAYELVVMDRWGQVLFSTQDRTMPWSGRWNGGAEVPTGVYVWRLRIQDAQGRVREHQGHVTLLR